MILTSPSIQVCPKLRAVIMTRITFEGGQQVMWFLAFLLLHKSLFLSSIKGTMAFTTTSQWHHTLIHTHPCPLPPYHPIELLLAMYLFGWSSLLLTWLPVGSLPPLLDWPSTLYGTLKPSLCTCACPYPVAWRGKPTDWLFTSSTGCLL